VSKESLADLTATERITRRIKVDVLRAKRLVRWALESRAFCVPEVTPEDTFPYVTYSTRIPLWRTDAGADQRLERGKRSNLMLAAPHLNGLRLQPSRPLSFWRAVGRPSAGRGFQIGMELRAGCIVPAVGGGLCLISNALFQAACELDWNIIERHGHNLDAAPDGGATWGLDATLFWPFVDLRIAPRRGAARLGVRVEKHSLLIEVREQAPRDHEVTLTEVERREAGGVRENRIERVVTRGGVRVRKDVVAVNMKRLLVPAVLRRNCMTCDRKCASRPRALPAGQDR